MTRKELKKAADKLLQEAGYTIIGQVRKKKYKPRKPK